MEHYNHVGGERYERNTPGDVKGTKELDALIHVNGANDTNTRPLRKKGNAR